MVVSDTKAAQRIFEERGTLVVENDVLLIDGDNRPGSLRHDRLDRFGSNEGFAPHNGGNLNEDRRRAHLENAMARAGGGVGSGWKWAVADV